MSSFEELCRDNFHPDALAKAAEQEAAEREGTAGQEAHGPDAAWAAAESEAADHAEVLSRASFRPDALAKASEQEALDKAEEDRSERKRDVQDAFDSLAASDAPGRDQVDHTILRRTPEEGGEMPAGGGAVVSRRSRISSFFAGLKNRKVPAQPKRERRRPTRRTATSPYKPGALRGALGGVRLGAAKLPLLLAIILVVLYLVFCLPIDRAISLSKEEREGVSSELSFHVPATPYYVLALGSDAREEDEISRTDTMILVRVDLVGGKLTMLSIPRDTKVEIEGHGTQKINAAYAFGGVAGAVRAVHELTGAPISQVAVIRFDGVESLVDYLGGVTVNVPVPINDWSYTGLVLPAGEQEMDGHTALLFSRVRHGFTLGDYQRQKDQRILIEAILQKILSLPPQELPGVVKQMGGLVGTSMRIYSIMPLMLRLKLGGASEIYQATVPSTTDTIDGVSYVIADETALAQMMDAIDAGKDPSALL